MSLLLSRKNFLCMMLFFHFSTSGLRAAGELNLIERNAAYTAQAQHSLTQFHFLARVGAFLALVYTSFSQHKSPAVFLPTLITWMGIEYGFNYAEHQFSEAIKVPMDLPSGQMVDLKIIDLGRKIDLLPYEVKSQFGFYKSNMLGKPVDLGDLPAPKKAALENILAFVSWSTRNFNSPKFWSEYAKTPLGQTHIRRILTDFVVVNEIFQAHSKNLGEGFIFQLNMILGPCRSGFESTVKI